MDLWIKTQNGSLVQTVALSKFDDDEPTGKVFAYSALDVAFNAAKYSTPERAQQELDAIAEVVHNAIINRQSAAWHEMSKED